ncbi:V-type ATP synthase subunit F [Microbacter sp. GSS18]|nr:V-type ATP synthase subunit F [Microbacter sp. GSS18]
MPDLLRIAVIGEEHLVDGYRLAGATVLVAADAEAVRRAWQALPEDAGVVVLTAQAAASLGEDVGEGRRMVAVMPV